ncbi:TolC family protein [Planctomycetota bacterium]
MRSVIFAGIMAVVLLGVVGPVLSSQETADPNKLQQINDYLRYASLNNAQLKAEFEKFKVAIEQIPQAGSLADPEFTYGYFIEEVETRTGPQRQKFELRQKFPWFGVIEARTDEAAAAAKAAHKRYQAKKLELFEQVKYTFYEFSYLAKAIEITEENLELIIHFEQVARARYQAAITSHPDIIRAQIELAIMEDRLKSLKELTPAITAELNSILNRPASSELPWPKQSEYKTVTINFDQLYNLILQNNPQLQAVDYDIQAARNKYTLAKKKSFPNFALGVSYIDTANAIGSGVDDSGKDPVMAMISLTLPIWTDNYKAAQRQAQAKVWQKGHEKMQMENTFAAEAKNLLYQFEDTTRKIALYRNVIIPKAREMLAASETAYRAGSIGFLSLIDAQRELLKYELYYHRTLAERSQKLAMIETLAGTSLPIINNTVSVKKK